ncbi:hypothetical protein [Streptomyces cavernae]|uniref:hypothetical protein n=1 Tax=Streptomyces cavernae TaxID=2259034 RepID=UPI000FEC1675|nr:hypothetical protein [Streptomyces cavernae]
MSDMANAGAGRAQQAGRTAKQEASATADRARQAAGEVAGTAAEQAKVVTGEAREQVGAVAGELRERVTEQVESQAQRGAETLRQWADDLSGLVDKAGRDSPAKTLVAQVADRGHRAADYLDKQGVEGMVQDVQDFARRRPGAFLGAATLAGLVIGRLAKAGSKSDGSRPRTSDEAPSGQAPPPLEQSVPASGVPPELPGYRGV